MKEKIQHYLQELEQNRKIKILLACETGSRAWGFPSPDSDYDIRLIYVHQPDWYLSINEPKDSVDLMLEDNEIDISGWELKKSLQLLKKSNPPLLERIQSPIVYQEDAEFVKEIRSLAGSCYSRIASMHHYLSMSKKMLDLVEANESFKLKKFFYALRTALVCKWILEKEQIPRIEFEKLYGNLGLGEELCQRIEELIRLKAMQDEAQMHQGESALMSCIRDCISQAEQQKDQLPNSKYEIEALNQLLRKYVRKYAH